MRPEDHYFNERLAGADRIRCPECDFELVYVRASRVRAVALVGENTEITLHMTDCIVCTRCHWWRQATANDVPALGGADARSDR